VSNVKSRVTVTTRHEYFAPFPVDQKDMSIMNSLARDAFSDAWGRNPAFDDDIWTSADDENVIVYFKGPSK
jgi:hypothetical protein